MRKYGNTDQIRVNYVAYQGEKVLKCEALNHFFYGFVEVYYIDYKQCIDKNSINCNEGMRVRHDFIKMLSSYICSSFSMG